MRKYEILMLLKPNLKADVKSKTIEKAEKLIGGKIVKKEEWGLKKLAYSIKKQTEAEYILLYVETEGENVIEYRKMVNISKEIMRTLILVHEKDFPYNRRTTKQMVIKERKPRKPFVRKENSNYEKEEQTENTTEKSVEKVKTLKENNEAKLTNETEDLSSLTKDKLVAIAKDKGLKGYSSLTKPALISLIEKES